jgi:hypothetical protein
MMNMGISHVGLAHTYEYDFDIEYESKSYKCKQGAWLFSRPLCLSGAGDVCLWPDSTLGIF